MIEKNPPKDGRRMVRILGDLIERYTWKQPITDELLYTFLDKYKSSIGTVDELESQLKGYEVCIRCLIDNLQAEDLMKVVRMC